MKKIALLTIALASLLAGCVAYDPHYRDGRDDRGYSRDRDRDRDGIPNRMDRDRDGDHVPNRQDARPDNPRRY